MHSRKYVILDDCFPVIGHETIAHAELAFGTNKQVTSAGFFSVSLDITPNPVMGDPDYKLPELFVNCWGESVSLKIKSNPETDAKIIKKFLIGG